MDLCLTLDRLSLQVSGLRFLTLKIKITWLLKDPYACLAFGCIAVKSLNLNACLSILIIAQYLWRNGIVMAEKLVMLRAHQLN